MSSNLYSLPETLTGNIRTYSGKVRDLIVVNNTYLISICSDRISAFDQILPIEIPHKGQILNRTAEFFLNQTSHICQNWFESSPHPRISYGMFCNPIALEVVVRDYLTGHLWRLYEKGIRNVCGNVLPHGLIKDQKLPQTIITPTIKAKNGHDTDIDIDQVVTQGIIKSEVWKSIQDKSMSLFNYGKDFAATRGLILVDTKYEFGLKNGEVILIDEVHTPDSSRYFESDSYLDFFTQGQPQKQLSKEFVREWLMEQGFSGQAGQQIPIITESQAKLFSRRYMETFERITDQNIISDDSLTNDELVSLVETLAQRS